MGKLDISIFVIIVNFAKQFVKFDIYVKNNV